MIKGAMVNNPFYFSFKDVLIRSQLPLKFDYIYIICIRIAYNPQKLTAFGLC